MKKIYNKPATRVVPIQAGQFIAQSLQRASGGGTNTAESRSSMFNDYDEEYN